jgi:hypothetical protein
MPCWVKMNMRTIQESYNIFFIQHKYQKLMSLIKATLLNCLIFLTDIINGLMKITTN